MKKNLFIISLILLVQAVSFAQPDKQNRLLKSVSSPRGNYIYLFDKEELGGKDSSKVAATDYFIIERLRYDFTEGTKKSAYVKIGEARRVDTYKEIQAYFSKSQVSEIKKLFGLKNDQDVVRYFNTHHFDREFPIIYDLIETRQALGQVFLDKDVKPGEVYMYKVTRVSKANQNEYWGFAVRQSHAPNYVLPYFKPMIKSLEASDSLVSITWKMAIPGNALDKIPVPKSPVEADKDGAMVRIPFGMLNTRAKVFAKKNNQFMEYATLMPVLNISKDTLTYTYVKKCMPEEEVTAYLVTEDEVYNQGISSDTAYAFAISNKIVPLIYGIRVKDVLDGVQLSWDKLPAKPYVVGIEIRRTNSEDVEDSLATLPVSDTSYTDYSIQVGQHYRYKVKALFLPLLGVEQKVPAEGIGTYTIFSRPLPPFDLTAENVNGNVQLTWDAVKEPSFYGYYIYRGTSSKKLDLVDGPVFTKTYLDSSGSLSGRTPYYYAVQTQNLRQDTSVLSPIVRIVPDRKIITSVPNQVEFYFANKVLRVSWNDLRKGDNAIIGYIVQKKSKDQKEFSLISTKPVDVNYIQDSMIVEGGEYDYRVATISVKGDTSLYGIASTYIVPKMDVMMMNVFYLRNVSDGIHISWPQVEAKRKAYNIYRREASETSFKKLATLTAKTFSFIDKEVKAETVYVYYLTITEQDDREGDKGKSISIRRIKNQL